MVVAVNGRNPQAMSTPVFAALVKAAKEGLLDDLHEPRMLAVTPMTGERPCRFCRAAYPRLSATDCEFEHRDEPRVYDLARAFARLFQRTKPTDEQVGWFLGDADAVVDDFDPTPDRWHVRKLPQGTDEFKFRMRINNVTYVVKPGPPGKEVCHPVRLATLREVDAEALRAGKAGDRRG